MSSGKESNLKNIASERAVLAGLLQHGKECFLETELFVTEDSFTVEFNKVLYKCIKHSFSSNEVVGYTEILSAARSIGLDQIIERNESLKHINGVMNTPVNIDNVSEHAKILKRLEFARKLQNTLRDIYRGLDAVNGSEPVASILSIVEKPVQDICLSFMKEDDLSPKSIGSEIDEYIIHLKENQGKSIGIPTGMPNFDNAIGGGLRRKCVDLIAARPKTGKSVFADNVALHISGNYNIPVLLLDTEMSAQDHWNRIIANMSEIEINEIASGKFYESSEKVTKVKRSVEKIKSIPYDYISIAGRQFDETLSIIKRWLLKRVGYDENGRLNDCVVIYDYLKLMTSSSISNNLAEFQVLGFQITSLHNFMVEHDCPCLSFVQLNRDGITKESTDVVSGSDRLVWLCTSFSIFKDKTQEEKQADGINNGNKKLIPIVSRHGPGIQDGGYICLDMEGKYAKIKELGLIREIKNANNQQGFADSEDYDSEEEDDDQDF